MQDSWLSSKADEIQSFADRKDMKKLDSLWSSELRNHPSSRWASGEAAGEETQEAVVADLHTGGFVLYGRFPQE